MKKNLILVICIVFLLNFSSRAEEKLYFDEAVVYALNNNNELQAKKYAFIASEKDINITRSNILPKIRADEFFINSDNPAVYLALRLNQRAFTANELAGTPRSINDPSPITSFITAFTATQVIYSRKANLAIRMAKTEYSAQKYTYLRTEEALVSQVAQAYLNIITANKIEQVTRQGIADAMEYLKIIEYKYNNAAGPYSDVLQAQTAVTEATQKNISAIKNLNIAKRALGIVLARSDGVDAYDSMPEIQLKSFNYYIQNALSRNDIKAMERNIKNAKNNVKLANSDLYPTVGSFASYQFYDPNAPFTGQGLNFIVGAFVNWYIFDGFKRKNEVLKAKDKEQEVKNYSESLKKAVLFKLFEVYSNVDESTKNLELANSALKAAEEGKNLVFKNWRRGLTTLDDLIKAQANLNNARANVVQSQKALKSTLIDLSFESGLITKELALECKIYMKGE